MARRQTLQPIPLDRLIAHERNRAVDDEKVAEMAESIRLHGLLTPLVVTEHLTEYDHWLLLDGHHRALAARQAGLSQVTCIVRHGLDESEDEQLIVMVVGNCQRKDMTAIDRAELFGLLRRTMSVAEISGRTGLTQGRIYDALALLDLDAETRERVRSGEVKVGEAARAVRSVRAAVRTDGITSGITQPRRVKVEAAHFTKRHPLAAAARSACDHRQRPLVGGLACGQCWEQAIRNDALATDER